MNRRGFVGSVLGSFIGSQGFGNQLVAEPVEEKEPPKLEQLGAIYEMFKHADSQSVRMFLVVVDQPNIYASHLATCTFDQEKLKAKLVCAPINITSWDLQIWGMGVIYTPRKIIIAKKPFSGPVVPSHGDQIHVTYDMEVGVL